MTFEDELQVLVEKYHMKKVRVSYEREVILNASDVGAPPLPPNTTTDAQSHIGKNPAQPHTSTAVDTGDIERIHPGIGR